MHLNRLPSNAFGGTSIDSSKPFCDEAGLPRSGMSKAFEASAISEVAKTSNGPAPKDHLRFGVSSAASRPARWTSPDDRKVFNVWALWVAAFYSSLTAALLAAMLLGAYLSGGREVDAAPAVRSIAK
jgi:hypothetical protein